MHAACTLLCTLLVSPVTQGGSRGAELARACADLHSSLQARGSRLLVLRGQPEEELPRVWRAWGVSRLCFEVDTEEYARTRDRRVCALAAEAGAPPHKLCAVGFAVPHCTAACLFVGTFARPSCAVCCQRACASAVHMEGYGTRRNERVGAGAGAAPCLPFRPLWLAHPLVSC